MGGAHYLCCTAVHTAEPCDICYGYHYFSFFAQPGQTADQSQQAVCQVSGSALRATLTGMRYDARWLTGTACLVASPKAFRPFSQLPCCFRRHLNGDNMKSISHSSWSSSTSSVGRERLQHLQQAASMLGMDAGLGMAGLSALSAVRLFTTSISPKRVRVVTDIDDTVKSSGNKVRGHHRCLVFSQGLRAREAVARVRVQVQAGQAMFWGCYKWCLRENAT